MWWTEKGPEDVQVSLTATKQYFFQLLFNSFLLVLDGHLKKTKAVTTLA